MPEKGFRSITVRKELYNDLQKLAEDFSRILGLKHLSIPKFLAYMAEEYKRGSILLKILGPSDVKKGSVVLEQWAWRTEFILRKIFADREIDRYWSTSYVRTEEYPEKADPATKDESAQWPKTLQDRVSTDSNFEFEKILVISKGAKGKTATLRWILDWCKIAMEHSNVKLFLIDEEDAISVLDIKNRKEDIKFLDMGIYGQKAVGFLPIDYESNPGEFKLEVDVSVREEAEKAFGKLKTKAIAYPKIMEKIGEELSRQKERKINLNQNVKT